jgi:HAE1 family hydrophobic/amphiphilic exporter-1
MEKRPGSTRLPITQAAITAWAVEHPRAVLAACGAILLAALCVVFGNVMPRRMMPYVESTSLAAVTEIPGMPAPDVEVNVSNVLEKSLSDVPGHKRLSSTSSDGLSVVTIDFPYGADMTRARLDVQSALDAARVGLPPAAGGCVPRLVPVDPLNVPVLTVAMVGSPQAGWTPEALRRFAEDEVTVALRRIPHVATVEVLGARRDRLKATVDPARLAASGYSLPDVRHAVDRYDGSPSAAGVMGETEEARYLSPKTIGDLPIGTKRGRATLVRDVADVAEEMEPQRSGFHFVDNTRQPGRIVGLHGDAVGLAVFQDSTASSSAVIAAIRARLDALAADQPGLSFHVAYDNSRFVNRLFTNTAEELIVAVLLCGLVVLLALGDRRAALISVAAIPVSVSAAILAMAPFGFSLNSSTLIGLILSIGRLVDDPVIDLHAIRRHLGMGKSAHDAVVDGITEVRRPVAAATLILALALVPLLVCGGITQAMFAGLAYPILFGLPMSYLVSLTLTAVLAKRALEKAGAAPLAAPESGLLAGVSRRLDRLDAAYHRVTLLLLRRRFAVVCAAVCAIIVGTGFYRLIGSEMMPLADIGQAYAMLQVQPGGGYARTERATVALERILLRHPEVERVSTEIGAQPGTAAITGYSANGPDTSCMMLTLKDRDERGEDVWQIVDRVRDEAADIGVPVACLHFKEMGCDVMASSEAPVEILVTGPDEHVLSRLAAQVADVARRTPGAYQVGTSWSVTKPAYRLDVDARRAAAVGLSPADVAAQAGAATGGRIGGRSYGSGGSGVAHVEVDPPRPDPAGDLLATTVATPAGQTVPLRSIASLRPVLEPPLIEHEDRKRAITVMAFYRKGGPPSMDLTMAILSRASSELNFPPGYTLEMRGDMTEMSDSFARLLKGLALASAMILFALILQFRGVLAPLQIILNVPLELTGAFAGLYLAHQSFSSVSVMAVIVLTGMDLTTAILLVDQIARRRADPRLTREEAVALACRDRLRPVLMTSLITIVTMAPVAILPRTGLDAYQPLGTVIVCGLAAGTVMSLFVIPVVHTLVDDLQIWMVRQFRRASDASVLRSIDTASRGASAEDAAQY